MNTKAADLRPLKFCMISTFFGAHSFGGDAVFVDRLSRALLRRGHQVDVVHCVDSFEMLRRREPLRSYTPPPGLRTFPLTNPLGALPLIWNHQTGRMGAKAAPLRRIIAAGDYDVIHFHNISLMGGPEILDLECSGKTVKIMTAHEWWLLCPLSTLWKFDDAVCRQTQCVRCTLRSGRSPQFWCRNGTIDRAINHLGALLFPSRFALELHRARGVAPACAVHLPSFLPADSDRGESDTGKVDPRQRPYFVCAGRLIREKGFQEAIAAMASLRDHELTIAGSGPFEKELRQRAAAVGNVRFMGQLDFPALSRLYRGARALIVPSQCYETFGYVVLEACAAGAPAIVRRGSALAELIGDGGGGLMYDTDRELVAAMRSLAADEMLRSKLVQSGQQGLRTLWSEEQHMEKYLALIARLRGESPPAVLQAVRSG